MKDADGILKSELQCFQEINPKEVPSNMKQQQEGIVTHQILEEAHKKT